MNVDNIAPEPYEIREFELDQHPILEFFKFEHMPERLQERSAPFCRLALRLVRTTAPGPELSVALRKLLEAKDAAVRAAL